MPKPYKKRGPSRVDEWRTDTPFPSHARYVDAECERPNYTTRLPARSGPDHSGCGNSSRVTLDFGGDVERRGPGKLEIRSRMPRGRKPRRLRFGKETTRSPLACEALDGWATFYMTGITMWRAELVSAR
jgi:hypothetical protein